MPELVDEIADVELTIECVKFMLGVDSLAVFTVKEKKLARVKAMLDKDGVICRTCFGTGKITVSGITKKHGKCNGTGRLKGANNG